MAARRSTFGNIRKLPSGRHQARYEVDGLSYNAPVTFPNRSAALAYLATIQGDIVRQVWSPHADLPRTTLFAQYAEGWLASRSLEARTRALYRRLLEQHLTPRLGRVPLRDITPQVVRDWHATTLTDRPTARAHAYSLLRTILAQAVGDQLLSANPCTIRGAGSAKRVHTVKPATLDELEQIAAAMPPRYRAMVLLASWCGLRFGELIELRRSDIDLKAGRLRVRRGAVRADGEVIVKKPKSDAGIRDVAVPPHLMPMLRQHLLEHAGQGSEGLLFPARSGKHLQPSTLYGAFYPARVAAGRPDLRWHDLRHTGAVLAAQTGATLAELMARLGHSTPGAAMRYQHAADDRDLEIARRLSVMAGGE